VSWKIVFTKQAQKDAEKLVGDLSNVIHHWWPVLS
jgi:predicted site-specific integrase-resolvase